MSLIVINAISALRGGGQTYLINLLKHYNLSNNNAKIILITHSKNKSIFSNIESDKISIFEAQLASKNIFHRVFWELFVLPIKLKSWNCNVYYAPGGIMLTKTPKNCLSITTLQNMLPFDDTERKRFPFFSYIRFKLWLLRYVFLLSYSLSDKVIFISEYSKSVVKQYLPSVDKKSTVIPHGLNNNFLDSNQVYNLPEALRNTPFYLYVSILDVYKAQKEIIEEWKLLSNQEFDYPLVLVGPKYNQYGEEVINLITELQLTKQVIYLGEVPYEELPGLYKVSRALIFASSCECCPNILLEKLAAAKPTFCSNIQPMPEFGDEAVIYFDPYTPKDLANKILMLEKDPAVMKTLSEKAYLQASKFDWETTTQNTINFLLN